ncbi:hypothetical protein Tco_0390594 [Tanacetum coccineum]
MGRLGNSLKRYTGQENIENKGQSVYSLTEIDLEQDNGITPKIPYSSLDLNNKFNFMEIRHEPRSPLKEHVEIPNEDDNGNGYAYNLTFSSHFSEMQANGSTGSGESSGLESDVQHPTKKM